MIAQVDDARLPMRFWSKVVPEPNSGCWLWTAGLQDGYGNFRIAQKTKLAHVIAYQALMGLIPVGLELDHLCRTQCCCNPAHLEPVTHAENARRGQGGAITAARQRAKTHCPRGHAYTAQNLYIQPTKGWRLCQECRKIQNRRTAERRRQT